MPGPGELESARPSASRARRRRARCLRATGLVTVLSLAVICARGIPERVATRAARVRLLLTSVRGWPSSVYLDRSCWSAELSQKTSRSAEAK